MGARGRGCHIVVSERRRREPSHLSSCDEGAVARSLGCRDAIRAAAVTTAVLAAAPAAASPAGPGLGDPFFPQAGNGG
jgi:hypothetical protein